MLPSNKSGQLIGDGAGGRSNNSARKLIHQRQMRSACKKREAQLLRVKWQLIYKYSLLFT